MSYLVREIEELQKKVRGHERVAAAMACRIDQLENELMDYRQTYGEAFSDESQKREAA